MFLFTIFLYFIVFLFNNNSFANLNNVINNNESFISKNNIETLINNNKNLSTRMRFFQYSKFFIGVHSLHSNNLQFETLYNFNQFDCITYIEILLALSISNTFEEFEKNILLINNLM